MCMRRRKPIHLFRDGKLDPYVNGYTFVRDPISFKKTWAVDETVVIPISFFVRSEPYKLWGFIPGDLHLIGPDNPEDPFYLLGSDKSGRDVFGRIIYSARVSLTVGLVGVALSLILGILIGGVSGLIGGWLDNIIQRVIEIIMSIPTLPFWLALAAVVPLDWQPLQVYFMITVILSLVGWTGMARVVRSKFLALREEDFILAATLDGVPRGRMIIAPHDAFLPQPHHRLHHPVHPRHDPGRNRPELPGVGLAPAGRQLGASCCKKRKKWLCWPSLPGCYILPSL